MSEPTNTGGNDQDPCPLSDEEADQIIESRLDQSKIGIDRDAHVAETRRLIAELASERERKVAPSAEMAALFSNSGAVASAASDITDGLNKDLDRGNELAVPTPIDSRQPTPGGRAHRTTAWLQRVAMVAALLIPLILIGNRAFDSTPPEPPQPASAPTEIPARPTELVPTEPTPTATTTPTPTATPTSEPDVPDAAPVPTEPQSSVTVQPDPAEPASLTPVATPTSGTPDVLAGDGDGDQSPDDADLIAPDPAPVPAVPTAPITPTPSAATSPSQESDDRSIFEFPTPPPFPTIERPTFEIPTPPPFPTIERPTFEIPTPPPFPTIERPTFEIPTPPPFPTIERPTFEIPTPPSG